MVAGGCFLCIVIQGVCFINNLGGVFFVFECLSFKLNFQFAFPRSSFLDVQCFDGM